MEKTCTKCGISKSLFEFYKEKRGLHGVRADCKSCVRRRKRNIEISRPPPDSLRVCTGCHETKPLSGFPTSSIHSTGYRPRCLRCKSAEAREYNKTHRKTNHGQRRKHHKGFQEKQKIRSRKRREVVNNMVREAKSIPCTDCGQKFPYYCMDFDHLDSLQKKDGIKEMKTTPSKRHILKEMDKCEVVCVNCHRMRDIGSRDDLHTSRNPQKVRNRQIILEAKSVPCADCDQKFPPSVMDFDHVRGEKIGIISRLAARFGRDRLLREIAKCDVVCSRCHRTRTFHRQAS